MFYLTSIDLLLVTATVADINIKKDDKNHLLNLRDPDTFSTPFPGGIVLKDPKDFDIPNDNYDVNPSTKQELANMLAYADNVMPEPNEDVIAVTSERFEKIQADYAKKEATSTENVPTTRKLKNVLRQNTRPPLEIAKRARSRAFALMTQFVYGARYKLQYGQRLRAAYNASLDYKIGSGYAKITSLQQCQLSLYSTMHFNLIKHYKKDLSALDLETYFKLYAAIVDRHIDVMDVMIYVKILIEESKKLKKSDTKAPESDTDGEDEND